MSYHTSLRLPLTKATRLDQVEVVVQTIWICDQADRVRVEVSRIVLRMVLLSDVSRLFAFARDLHCSRRTLSFD